MWGVSSRLLQQSAAAAPYLRWGVSVVFPVVMYGCESWTIKKAERRRTDAFKLWCRRRLLRVPWTARRSSQSILKEISPGCSLEGLMLKLKLQYFGHLITHWKRPWCWQGLGAGGEGDDRGWDGWMASPTQWIWAWVNSGSWWWTGRPGVLRFMGSQIVRHDWVTGLNRWGLGITFLIVPSFGTSFTAITVLNSGWPHYLSFTGCMDFPPRRIVFKQSIVVWSLSRVQLFAAPWTAACQTSAPFTISWSLLKLKSIELMMPPNHLVLCRPLLISSIFSCINS